MLFIGGLVFRFKSVVCPIRCSLCQRGIFPSGFLSSVFFIFFSLHNLLFVSFHDKGFFFFFSFKAVVVLFCSVHINWWSSPLVISSDFPCGQPNFTIYFPPFPAFVEGFCTHLETGRHIHHDCQNSPFKNCELYTLAKGIFIFKEIKYIWPHLCVQCFDGLTIRAPNGQPQVVLQYFVGTESRWAKQFAACHTTKIC